MTVARILAKKGRNVATTSEDQTLQEISVDLTRRGIGALVVVDSSGSIVGIISERDIVAAISNRGTDALADPVALHMTKNPKLAAEDDTVHSTMETMTIERFRHMPVINRGQLVGLVSIGDVVKYRIEEIEYEHKALRDYIATA
jgi:CBS domain-containing protein